MPRYLSIYFIVRTQVPISTKKKKATSPIVPEETQDADPDTQHHDTDTQHTVTSALKQSDLASTTTQANSGVGLAVTILLFVSISLVIAYLCSGIRMTHIAAQTVTHIRVVQSVASRSLLATLTFMLMSSACNNDILIHIVTRGYHQRVAQQRVSPEGITRGYHQRVAQQRVSPEGITRGYHQRVSPEGSTTEGITRG